MRCCARGIMAERIPVYSMQNELLGYATQALARKLKKQEVAEVFTKDPFSLVVSRVPMLDHPLMKEVIMAKKEQTPTQTPTTEKTQQGIDETKVPVMAQTEEQQKDQKEHKPPKTISSDDFLAEAQRRAAETRSGTVKADEKTDPSGLYVSNRYSDHLIIVSDVWLDKNDAQSAMVFQPGEVKRLDILGEMYVNGEPVAFKNRDDLFKSNRMTLLIAQRILVLGRLAAKQMVRHGYWDGKVSPKEVVDAMGDKTKGGNFQIEINKRNDWYFKRLAQQVKLEKEINDAEAGTDPDEDVLKQAAELEGQTE